MVIYMRDIPVRRQAMSQEIELIKELVGIIQGWERKGLDISVDEIKTVWKAKTYLGYSHPINVENGTGKLIR